MHWGIKRIGEIREFRNCGAFRLKVSVFRESPDAAFSTKGEYKKERSSFDSEPQTMRLVIFLSVFLLFAVHRSEGRSSHHKFNKMLSNKTLMRVFMNGFLRNYPEFGDELTKVLERLSRKIELVYPDLPEKVPEIPTTVRPVILYRPAKPAFSPFG